MAKNLVLTNEEIEALIQKRKDVIETVRDINKKLVGPFGELTCNVQGMVVKKLEDFGGFDIIHTYTDYDHYERIQISHYGSIVFDVKFGKPKEDCLDVLVIADNKWFGYFRDAYNHKAAYLARKKEEEEQDKLLSENAKARDNAREALLREAEALKIKI